MATLRVIGGPVRLTEEAERHRVRRIITEYDPLQKLTVINCDVDIVTLGIALEVLKKQYKEGLEHLTPGLAARVQSTIERVVANEEY